MAQKRIWCCEIFQAAIYSTNQTSSDKITSWGKQKSLRAFNRYAKVNEFEAKIIIYIFYTGKYNSETW